MPERKKSNQMHEQSKLDRVGYRLTIILYIKQPN